MCVKITGVKQIALEIFWKGFEAICQECKLNVSRNNELMLFFYGNSPIDSYVFKIILAMAKT